jgi:hypothetical protein
MDKIKKILYYYKNKYMRLDGFKKPFDKFLSAQAARTYC